jgi:hypothetical protein
LIVILDAPEPLLLFVGKIMRLIGIDALPLAMILKLLSKEYVISIPKIPQN